MYTNTVIFQLNVSNIGHNTGSILRRIDLTKFATSTKIEALTQELINMRKQSPGSKAIVFSQVRYYVDLHFKSKKNVTY
jgi:hypothetical protein